MKKFIGFITSFTLSLAVFITLGGTSAFAQSSIQAGAAAAKGSGAPTNLFGDSGIITTITNVLLFVAGALAVIMIIIGGLRYATSGGNSSSVTAAKNTVMYAIIGLIIAFLAFAVVNWVLGAITPGGSAGFTNT